LRYASEPDFGNLTGGLDGVVQRCGLGERAVAITDLGGADGGVGLADQRKVGGLREDSPTSTTCLITCMLLSGVSRTPTVLGANAVSLSARRASTVGSVTSTARSVSMKEARIGMRRVTG
jgi:hypothetical protein